MHNLIISTKIGEYAITRASYIGHTEIVEALVKANANVDVQNKVTVRYLYLPTVNTFVTVFEAVYDCIAGWENCSSTCQLIFKLICSGCTFEGKG